MTRSQKTKQRSIGEILTAAIYQLLPKHSRIAAKFRRIAYGKDLKHMRNVSAHFNLIPNSDHQTFDIFWHGKKLGSTIPFPPAITDDDIWLIATGPSINDLDLSKLNGKIVMGLNGSITACESHGIIPTYYAITDRNFFEHRMHLVEKAVLSGAHCFFSFNGISRICELSPHLLQSGNISLLETVNRQYNSPQLSSAHLHQICAGDPDMVLPNVDNPKVGWSRNLNKGVFTANTITYIGCQIAAYLHAKNTFILGMDLGSNSSSHARSYETGNDALPTTIDKDYDNTIFPAFKLLSSLPLSTTFYNVSINSRLPGSVLQKLTFDEALSTHHKTSS